MMYQPEINSFFRRIEKIASQLNNVNNTYEVTEETSVFM